jgi:hypothetical protein
MMHLSAPHRRRLALMHLAPLDRNRWFTRGWALQELIAPASLEFFSRERDRLGSERSLEENIHEITRVATEALRGRPPPGFEIEERFSWADCRETKRHEDSSTFSLRHLQHRHVAPLRRRKRKGVRAATKEDRQILELQVTFPFPASNANTASSSFCRAA